MVMSTQEFLQNSSSFFSQKVTANPWPQTNRSELLSKSCHLKLRILHLLVLRFGLLTGTGKQQVFQLCFESNENMMNMKNEIKWKARSSMNATDNNALQDNYFKHFQTTISQWCSINVPFKVASLTSAWKASVSFSATKNGSTSTPKHNFSGENTEDSQWL